MKALQSPLVKQMLKEKIKLSYAVINDQVIQFNNKQYTIKKYQKHNYVIQQRYCIF